MNVYRRKFVILLIVVSILLASCSNSVGNNISDSVSVESTNAVSGETTIDANLLFEDVPESHFAYESIKKVYDAGHMTGIKTEIGEAFEPDEMVTGLEIYESLWSLAGTPEPITEGELFIDLESKGEDMEFADSYVWAMYSGIAYVEWRVGGGDVPDGGIANGRMGSKVYPVKNSYVMPHRVGGRVTRTDVVLTLYYYVTTYLGADVSCDTDMSRFRDWDTEKIMKSRYGLLLYPHPDEMIPAWKWAVGCGFVEADVYGYLHMGEQKAFIKYVTR
ncbi:MAG: hypothetical protein IKZ03_05940, partial [Clostridia bacterium]|nr:hypothetical protein [Clostridia bacterium]